MSQGRHKAQQRKVKEFVKVEGGALAGYWQQLRLEIPPSTVPFAGRKPKQKGKASGSN